MRLPHLSKFLRGMLILIKRVCLLLLHVGELSHSGFTGRHLFDSAWRV